MEFTRESLKFTVVIDECDVIITAIDYSTLADYKSVLTNNSYPNIPDVRKLYQVIIDAFGGKTKECNLVISQNKAKNNIKLIVTIVSYMFSDVLRITLTITKETDDVKSLTNKLEYLNDKLRLCEKANADLRNKVNELYQFVPHLTLWQNFIPTYAGISVTYHGGACHTTHNATGLHHIIPHGPLILRNDIFDCGITINLSDGMKYSLVNLLRMHNPRSFIINLYNSSARDIMKNFIENEIGRMINLETLHILGSDIKSVNQLLLLENLTELRLVDCDNIKDLQSLQSHKKLKRLFVSAKMNLGIFHNVDFEVKLE